MQTTLRIDNALYRAAKAAAALEGQTLTSFIESALRMRLQPAKRASMIPTFDSGVRASTDLLELIKAADEEAVQQQIGKYLPELAER